MPAIPAPTMQTSALIFLSSAGMDGSFDVADQSETPSLEMEKLRDLELATRRREDRCAITFSPVVQLLPTPINNHRAMSQSTPARLVPHDRHCMRFSTVNSLSPGLAQECLGHVTRTPPQKSRQHVSFSTVTGFINTFPLNDTLCRKRPGFDYISHGV
jgi:hypothetical protein